MMDLVNGVDRDTADRVVQGKGKFEELMACAHEIAASTTQLVVASKVKADRGSKNLAALSSASKSVNTCTGSVVASAKTGAQIVEDAGEFSDACFDTVGCSFSERLSTCLCVRLHLRGELICRLMWIFFSSL